MRYSLGTILASSFRSRFLIHRGFKDNIIKAAYIIVLRSILKRAGHTSHKPRWNCEKSRVHSSTIWFSFGISAPASPSLFFYLVLWRVSWLLAIFYINNNNGDKYSASRIRLAKQVGCEYTTIFWLQSHATSSIPCPIYF